MSLPRLAGPALLTDHVFTAIQDAIMNGEIAAGARLRLQDLAEQLGTSSMPVREALGRLEQAGLVQRLPHRGAVVVDVGLDELAHVYEARSLLEVEAARLGAARIDAAGLAAMRIEQAGLVAAVEHGRPAEALDRDEELLRLLYVASGNPVLVELVQGLWRRCRAFKLLGVRSGSDPDQWASFQAPLLAAAAAGDGDTAARLTSRSLDDARERIRQLLRAGDAAETTAAAQETEGDVAP